MAYILKLEIAPSFHPKCCFQLVQGEGDLRLIVSVFAAGNTYENSVLVLPELLERVADIKRLAERIVSIGLVDTRWILDGVELTCSVENSGQLRTHKFRCPKPKTDELDLVINFVNLAQRLDHNERFINYIELIEGYFLIKRVFKVTEGDAYVIRLHGSLTSDDKSEVSRLFQEAISKENVCIDMTNFEGMGTIVFDCFKVLESMKNVTIKTTRSCATYFDEIGFTKYMVGIGFDLGHIHLVD